MICIKENIMELALMGVALAFNLLILKYKLENDRWVDAMLDGAILVSLALIFGGTIKGLIIATIASAIVSLWLLAFPPKALAI